MGIYPDKTWRSTTSHRQPSLLPDEDRVPKQVATYTYHVPGLTQTFVYELVAVIEERTNCYCCTCPDDGLQTDPACRNHGWAATRPCEEHDMPGQPWGDEMCTDACRGTRHAVGCRTGTMPNSVQVVRQRRRESEERQRRLEQRT